MDHPGNRPGPGRPAINLSFFGTPPGPGIIRDVVILTVLFIVGVFAGDAIEGLRR